MEYFINEKEVCKEEFEKEWNKALEEEVNKPNSPTKEKLQEILTKCRSCRIRDPKTIFIACEEEILEMRKIIEENEYDPWDNDGLQIAVALWNKGYRLKEEIK